MSIEDIFRHHFGVNRGNSKQRPHKLLLKIYFSTETDLWGFAQGRGYNLGAWAHFCDAPEQKVVLSSTRVYWNRRRVDMLKQNLIEQSLEAQSGQKIQYYMFALVSRREVDLEFISFDLNEEPRDICIDLSGADGLLAFRSNDFVVPKDEIVAALRDLPPYFRNEGVGEQDYDNNDPKS